MSSLLYHYCNSLLLHAQTLTVLRCSELPPHNITVQITLLFNAVRWFSHAAEQRCCAPSTPCITLQRITLYTYTIESLHHTAVHRKAPPSDYAARKALQNVRGSASNLSMFVNCSVTAHIAHGGNNYTGGKSGNKNNI